MDLANRIPVTYLDSVEGEHHDRHYVAKELVERCGSGEKPGIVTHAAHEPDCQPRMSLAMCALRLYESRLTLVALQQRVF